MESLTHSKWDCKYHVVFVPKYRKKALYGKIRLYLKEVFHELARQKGCRIESGSMVRDHVHMCISIPPKYAVSEVKCNSNCETIWRKKEEFFRREFLGKRICCFDDRT